MPFTNLEYGQMVFLYGYCNGNARATAREYARRYPNRVPPSPATITSACRRLCESGSTRVTSEGRGRPNVLDNVQLVDNILQAFNEDSTTSVQRVAAQLNVSYKVVWNFLRAHRRHPYHHTRVQGLEPGQWTPPSKASIFSMDDRTCFAFFQPDFVDGLSHVHPCRSVQSTQRTLPGRRQPSSGVNHYQREFRLNVWLGVIAD